MEGGGLERDHRKWDGWGWGGGYTEITGSGVKGLLHGRVIYKRMGRQLAGTEIPGAAYVWVWGRGEGGRGLNSRVASKRTGYWRGPRYHVCVGGGGADGGGGGGG